MNPLLRTSLTLLSFLYPTFLVFGITILSLLLSACEKKEETPPPPPKPIPLATEWEGEWDEILSPNREKKNN